MLRQEPFNTSREPWNKGKLVGQKPPAKLNEIWSIRIRLQLANKRRDVALFNLAIDSKLRACDLLKLRLNNVEHGGRVMSRAIVMQQKKHKGPFSLKSLHRLGNSSCSGAMQSTFVLVSICSRAD